MDRSSLAQKVVKIARKVRWEARALGRARSRLETLPTGGGGFVRLCNEPAFIEPQDGYVVTAAGRLLEESLDPQFPYYFPPVWRYHLPDPSELRKRVADPSNVRRFPALVSMRHLFEWNYYHFHLDVLGKLEALNQAGIPRDIPLVVGKYAQELPFARALLGRAGKREWLHPDADNRTVFLADRVYYVVTRSPYGARVRTILDELGVEPPDPDARDRVFLTRNKPGSRCLTNQEEIHAIARRSGFEIVDAARMSTDEQIGLFRRTRAMVALHGAGMTNILYRAGAPLSLLEVSARQYFSTDMRIICEELGFTFDAIRGEALPGIDPQLADFHVDPAAFEAALARLLHQADSRETAVA
jgi:capsular polysaccharide biosynthesis protein